jgi:hypothetical protein
MTSEGGMNRVILVILGAWSCSCAGQISEPDYAWCERVNGHEVLVEQRGDTVSLTDCAWSCKQWIVGPTSFAECE